MIIYKLEDRLDQLTGKKVGVVEIYDHVICDFTGKKGDFQEELGNQYNVDYGSLDPCMGCMDIETKTAKKWNYDAHSLTTPYHIDEINVNLMDIIEAYEIDEGEKPQWVSHMFRWARTKTVDRLLSEGTYTLGQLGLGD